MKLLIAELGVTDYDESYALQQQLVSLRQQGAIDDIVLLLEHPPVLTIGRSGAAEHIVAPRSVLEAEGVKVRRINRGGDVTYHGPGQIVGYPILHLDNYGRDIPRYVRNVEETFIRLLGREYGIAAGRDDRYPGVWVGGAKITAVGCAVKKWVTMHGFAFNVNTRLDHFQWIIPCGIEGKGVTSLSRLVGRGLNLSQVNRQVGQYFAQVFGRQPELLAKEAVYRLAEGGGYGQAKTGLA